MTAPLPPHALRGRCVLIAHEDVFHRSYLEDVFTGSGAQIAGVERDAAAAVARLEVEPLLDALVLSPQLPDHQSAALADIASRRGIAIVVIEPARGTGSTPLAADAVLTAPYAGFQVVDAVAKLLAVPQLSAPPAGRPHVREHRQ